MYIDQGTIIMNMGLKKEAQSLENVKEMGVLNDREVVRAIREAIISEEGAIIQYENIVDSTTNEDIKATLQSIADEEKVHVGELQQLLNNLIPGEEKLINDGEKEIEANEANEANEENIDGKVED